MTEQTMPDLKWTKKPVTIEAWQFTEEIALQYWENRTLPPFGCRSVSGEYKKNTKVVRDAYFHIDTLEGCMKASLGDWIIKGVKGEFYPCKPDIFEATYTRHDPTPKPAEGVTGETSDGYHTFNELYEHRHILFLAVLTANIDKAWRSKLHSDGTMFDDWFIAGLNTDAGQATYHLPMRIWELFKYIPELGRAPEWDGHTSNDVLVRIRDMAFFDGVKALQPAAQKTEGAECCDVDLSETVWHDKYHTLCEQSWKALGISEYTGLSIPEHISALASRASVDVEGPTPSSQKGGCDYVSFQEAQKIFAKYISCEMRDPNGLDETAKAMLSYNRMIAAKFPELVGGRE